MKKMLALILSLLMALSLGGCWQNSDADAGEVEQTKPAATADVSDAAGQTEPAAASVNDAAEQAELAPKSADNLTKRSTLAPTAPEGKDSLVDHFVPTDYDYVEYGVFAQIDEMDGRCLVGAFEPLDEGGAVYEGYPWRTLYIPTSVLEEAGIDVSDIRSRSNEKRAVRVTVVNDARDGGFISLPSMVTAIEPIALNDIPMWGGA